jgi:hypothetical protein
MEPCDSLTRMHARAVAQNKRSGRTVDIEAKNAAWIAAIFEHRLKRRNRASSANTTSASHGWLCRDHILCSAESHTAI